MSLNISTTLKAENRIISCRIKNIFLPFEGKLKAKARLPPKLIHFSSQERGLDLTRVEFLLALVLGSAGMDLFRGKREQ